MDDLSGRINERAAAPAAPRWKSAQCLAPVQRLNERCIELLCDIAPSADVELQIIKENAELWAQLEPEARRRLARVPLVIVDAQFKNDEWWRRVAQSAGQAAGAHAISNGLPSGVSEELMYETLMFGWQIVGSNRTIALTSFAMSPAVAETIAALTPKSIREIAGRQYSSIEMRWVDDVEFWRELLHAAIAANEEDLAALHLHAKLVVLGELVRLRE